MLVFHGPFKPRKPKVPDVSEDLTAEEKAREEAARRARSQAQQGGRQASLLSGGAGSPQSRIRSLLGIG